MDEENKKTRRQIAELKKIAQENAQAVLGAKGTALSLGTFEDVLNNHEIAGSLAAPKRGRGRPTKYDPTWMLDAVIEAGRMGASKEKTAAMLRINNDTLYEWCKKHTEFSDAVKEGESLALVWWENFGQAGALGLIDGFNPTAYIFQMKARFPHKYRDVRVIQSDNGQPLIDARSVTINARELEPEYRENLKLALIAAKRAMGEVVDDE